MGRGSDSLPVSATVLGRKTYLADSMQFFLELALRISGSGVYYIMPSFRGEEPDERHLNEFSHIEAEIPGSLSDVMRTVERLLQYVVDGLTSQNLVNASFSRAIAEVRTITYEEVLRLLGDNPALVRRVPFAGMALTSGGEQEILRRIGAPVWVTHPPIGLVPFYQKAIDQRALAADLLLGIGETVGCGERHFERREVESALASHEVDPVPYRWYAELKEMKRIQTAGFGLGLERLLLWLLQHDDIRDVQLLPRLKGVETLI